MTKKKLWRIVLFVILILGIISTAYFSLPQKQTKSTYWPQTKQIPQPTKKSANSPEGVTQAYYTWYAACLKKHTKDLSDAATLQKDCPLHGYTGMTNTLVQKNQLTYTDQVLCDEGIPIKMFIGKAYIGTDKTALVDVTTVFQDHHYTIPVSLRKETGIWKIFRIDCDLDGHID